jgi:alkanesulfonate monooxygenase SsuD/methylene tetrahydromethanopterin reductase-like flavin-dependent oxidoreductase (luciferase family)
MVPRDGPAGARPAIAVVATSAQIAESLRRTLEETGARRLLVARFTREEMRLFAAEVLPALGAEAKFEPKGSDRVADTQAR